MWYIHIFICFSYDYIHFEVSTNVTVPWAVSISHKTYFEILLLLLI